MFTANGVDNVEGAIWWLNQSGSCNKMNEEQEEQKVAEEANKFAKMSG